ncbi:hypothetical protein K1719_008539 [Acacia pycnantha]|nr:hypothetical protein K1719_008539 [Acacia pycnantha]
MLGSKRNVLISLFFFTATTLSSSSLSSLFDSPFLLGFSGFFFASLLWIIFLPLSSSSLRRVKLDILHLGWHSGGLIRYLCEFGGKPRNRLHLKLKSSQNPNSPNKTNFLVDIDNPNGHVNPKEGEHHDREVHDEDEVFDVMTLRKLVKIERQRANKAYEELEKERTASSSAADEAMAMILRLQSEKSSVEIQSNQYRRVAEQKQEYDQNVIDSLRLIIKEQESERDMLHDRLKLYREKLSQLISEDEIDQLDRIHESKEVFDLSAEEDDDDPNGSDSLISSLEMDSQKDLVSSVHC